MSTFSTVGLTALALLLSYFLRRRAVNARRRLPPGPKGWPIIGNALALPHLQPWVEFAKWGTEKYGPIFYCTAPGQSILVVNSFDIAQKLLDKRSGIYSGRIYPPMMQLSGFSWLFSNMSYGDNWRVRRKMFHSHFHTNFIKHYDTIIEKRSKQLLRRLFDTPENFFWHVRVTAGSIIIEIVYGHDVQGDDDKFIRLGEQFVKSFESVILPGSYYVDVLPWLRYVPSWFPGGGFQKDAARITKTLADSRDLTFAESKRRIDQDISPECYISTLLADIDSDHPNPEDYARMVRDTAGVAYGAGVDTSAAAIKTFIMLMAQHPDIQRKAQAEIDRVIGHRLAEAADRSSLPYVEALIKEILRWMPGLPVALPHQLTEDDVFEGWDIPKDTVVLANIWAMMRDPEVYPSPELFDPERYLGEKPQRDPRFGGVFGFGRRVCPGRPLAEASVFLNVSRLLTCFNIAPAKDASGDEIPIDALDDIRSPTFIGTPTEFQCEITPRSDKVAALLA